MASDAVISNLQDRVGALVADDPARHLPATDHGWRRIFGRLELDPPLWALLAYEPDLDVGRSSAWLAQTVEVFDVGFAGKEGGPAAVSHPAGDLVITSIGDDPRLTGLRLLADGPADVSLLRYRPQRRCTLRIAVDGHDYIAKVLADDRGAQFHRDAIELWSAAQRGELGFRVAEPVRWDQATRSVWQGIVRGSPVASALLDEDGAAIARLMGQALGTLARSNVRPSSTVTSDDQLRRTQRAVTNAVRRLPELAGDLGRILELFAARHAALSPDRLVPVHGAPHMHQWLIDDDDDDAAAGTADNRLGLIDFDRFALGEVELDIATLLVELDYEEELRATPAAIETAVITGFHTSGVEIDRSRLRLYSAHKRTSKVTREAWALRTDGARRARRHLSRIVEDLE